MKFESPGITGEYMLPLNTENILVAGCGAYGYDINQLCSAWREAPHEMTKEQYQVNTNPLFPLLPSTNFHFLGMETDTRTRNELEEKHYFTKFYMKYATFNKQGSNPHFT